ncbi:unnamed protein product [Amoebophrya sp. A120]|nr:unnamed protein product [Amoebophrya sp. A120]|eukprot:GSA120T00006646001.1
MFKNTWRIFANYKSLVPALLLAAPLSVGSSAAGCAAVSEAGAAVLDVRNQSEWDAGHLGCAQLAPNPSLTSAMAANLIGADKTRRVVVYCRSGGRAGVAKTKLEGWGYTNVYNAGGYDSLVAAGCANCGATTTSTSSSATSTTAGSSSSGGGTSSTSGGTTGTGSSGTSSSSSGAAGASSPSSSGGSATGTGSAAASTTAGAAARASSASSSMSATTSAASAAWDRWQSYFLLLFSLAFGVVVAA